MKDIVLGPDKTVIRIGQFAIGKINLNNIRFFMSANNITLKKETKRLKLLELISNARTEYEIAANKLLPKNSGTKPTFLTTDNTILRLISCYFDQEIREEIQKIGSALSKDEVDSRRMKADAFEIILPLHIPRCHPSLMLLLHSPTNS